MERELLYRALASPLGIAVGVASGETILARQKLYAARRAAGDSALDSLQFRMVVEKEIWILKTPQTPTPPQSPEDGATTLEALGL